MSPEISRKPVEFNFGCFYRVTFCQSQPFLESVIAWSRAFRTNFMLCRNDDFPDRKSILQWVEISIVIIIIIKQVLSYSVVSSMAWSFYLYAWCNKRYLAVQRLFCRLLLPGFVPNSSQHHCVIPILSPSV